MRINLLLENVVTVFFVYLVAAHVQETFKVYRTLQSTPSVKSLNLRANFVLYFFKIFQFWQISKAFDAKIIHETVARAVQ